MVRAHPEFINAYKTVIAALGHLGRRNDARPYIQKLMVLEPGFSIQHFEKVYPLKRSRDRGLYVRGLRLAGVPNPVRSR